MPIRKLYFLISVLFVVAFAACKKKIVPDFTYEPAQPRAGQTITFTNTTTEGEFWNWTFGDATTSTSKNPSKVYRAPGVYSVSLRVDSNDNYMRTKEIIVYDTIPVISSSVDTVEYYEPFTLSVLVYNPYYRKVTYDWTFSENAVSDQIDEEHKSDKASINLFFNKTNTTETILLTVTVGDSVYNISHELYVHDVPAPSVVMVDGDGNLWRQRLYVNGLEEASKWMDTHFHNVVSTAVYNDVLYVFDAGSHITPAEWTDEMQGDGRIVAVNLTAGTQENVITTTQHPRYSFYRGMVRGNYIYWTDYDDFIYKAPISVRNKEFAWDAATQNTYEYYLLQASHIGYFNKGLSAGQPSGGIAIYADTYFWAKYGSGKGVYRFTNDDILNEPATDDTPAPTVGHILADYSVETFALDEINRKIYFVDNSTANAGLWVANIDGRNPRKITSDCTGGIYIDNHSDKFFFTDSEGVKSCRLMATDNNVMIEEPQYFSSVQATSIVVDPKFR